jgi:hypothetical protein
MFAILVPATLSPLILTLLWGERKAKTLGLVEEDRRHASCQGSPLERLRRITGQLNIVGLVLLAVAVALILLPLTLSKKAAGGWRNGEYSKSHFFRKLLIPFDDNDIVASIIAMLVVGIVLLLVYGLWDFKYAKRPVIPMRFIKNRGVLGAALIGFFDFVSNCRYFWALHNFTDRIFALSFPSISRSHTCSRSSLWSNHGTF